MGSRCSIQSIRTILVIFADLSDPLAELHAACEKQGVRFGVYYSQSQDCIEGEMEILGRDGPIKCISLEQYYREKVLMQVKELVIGFGCI